MSKEYTAVILFHGVGDPQRHVSLSSFLDHLDLFGQTQAETAVGSAQRFKYRSAAQDGGHVLPYVELLNIRKRPDGTGFLNKRVRLYEAYWVPEAGVRYTTIYLLGWLLSRSLNPIKLLFSKWRSYPSLRLWNLVYMASKASTSAGTYLALERAYHDFDAWENRRLYPSGSYAEFHSFVEKRFNGKNKTDVLKLLSVWKKTSARYHAELFSKCIYYVILCAMFIFVFAFASYQTILNLWMGGFWKIISLQAAVALISTYVIFAGWMSLRHYAVDVLTWTLDAEKDERIKARDRVVQLGRKTIRAVVQDERCTDCVLIGHSLGSCIAIESLLREGQYVRAKGLDRGATHLEDDILKVRDVFTLGSPIDRIFYFFESDRTFSHRYNRLYEEQRLTVNLPPFWNLSEAGTARVTNFWSRFDPISSELNSLRKKVAERSDAVKNIECLPKGVPLPISSHISYFSDPSVMSRIYKSIMTGGDISPIEAKYPSRPSIIATLALFVAPLLLGLVLLSALIAPKIGIALTPLLLIILLMGSRAARRLRAHHGLHSGAYLTR